MALDTTTTTQLVERQLKPEITTHTFVFPQMLEHYEEYEEARKMLNEYAYNSKFPANPNAHVFFYQFLKRRGEPRKTQISALRVCFLYSA